MVGPPASGKSTFCEDFFADYERVNQDTLKTFAKCKKAAKGMIQNGKSVVIDNTNGSVEVRLTPLSDTQIRRKWIDLASELKVPIRAVVLDVAKPLAEHLNAFRSIGLSGDGRYVPTVAINMFFSRYKTPKKEEGFQRIDTVPFIPKSFTSKEEEDFFYSVTY